MFTTTNPSHSPSPELLIKLLTREGPVNRLTVLVEDTVGRGLARLPLPEVGGHQEDGGDQEENCTEFYLDEDDLKTRLSKALSVARITLT